LKRIQNQLPEEEKIQKSDFVVYNIELQNTFKEVDQILKILSKA
jgi:dephospho-CoA kinase